MSAGILAACQNPASTEDSGQPVDTAQSESSAEAEAKTASSPVKLYPKGEIAEFPDATLELKTPKNGQQNLKKSVDFDFVVSNYALGAQTEKAKMNLANSENGQHIHLIVDNDPYSAHYEGKFSKEIEPGQHYAIAFLSRSYHESVKNPEAYEVFQFSVGEMSNSQAIDLSLPALFYSRPKGTYSGAGAQQVLLDFYLHNTSLSADGNKVKVRINNKTEFVLDKWQPYILEGLPMGENRIDIELLGADGNLLDVPINSVTRVFNLEE